MNRIIKALKNPKLAINYLLNQKIFRIIPDKLYIKIKYRLGVGKPLNLNNPKAFTEKIQWLKLYDRNPIYTNWVDKYLVREYIEKTIGGEYLIPLLGIYYSYDEIDFHSLPKEFVLKPNHTSGDIYICHDKDQIDHVQLKKDINRWLKREYYWIHREWPYKNVKPRIICEKYMVDEDCGQLIDYKFHCCNGVAKGVFIGTNRQITEGLQVDFYDMDWNLTDLQAYCPRSGKFIEKPKNFDKMVEFAEKLSRNLPFLRVDFYEVNGEMYFGELTFYPGTGILVYNPAFYDDLLGSWVELPQRKNYQL